MPLPDAPELAFFRLRQPPFGGVITPDRVFTSNAFATAQRTLIRSLGQGDTLVVLTGAPGVGKTTLWQSTASLLQPTFLSRVTDPQSTADDVRHQLARDVGAGSNDEASIGKALAAVPWGVAGALLVIDAGDQLSAAIAEQLRRLLNLHPDTVRLQVLLVGSGELEEHLARPELAALGERVSARCRLEPMEPLDSAEYIVTRTALAGRPDLFEPRAIEAIVLASDGVPRVIDQLAETALTQAFKRGSVTVTKNHVAGSSSEATPNAVRRGVPARVIVAASLIAVAASALVAWRMSPGEADSVPTAIPAQTVQPAPTSIPMPAAPPVAVVEQPPPPEPALEIVAPQSARPSEVNAVMRARAMAAAGDVRGILALQRQLEADPAALPESRATVASLVEQAQMQRLKLDQGLLRGQR